MIKTLMTFFQKHLQKEISVTQQRFQLYNKISHDWHNVKVSARSLH